jgi:hypothetical protein
MSLLCLGVLTGGGWDSCLVEHSEAGLKIGRGLRKGDIGKSGFA